MSPARPRVMLVDQARTLALIAMAVYHFAFDLEMFGYLPRGMAMDMPLRGLAIATASSFLFLAGVSLVLAHGGGIRWPGLWRRWGMIAGAALIISVGSWLWQPDFYIYFGILHAIAVFTILGLVLLNLPAPGLVLLAGLGFVMPQLVAVSQPVLSWTGLLSPPRPALDFVPVFPWVAAYLLGMAMGKLGQARGWWARLSVANPSRPARALAWPGQHSLAVYLIHQPVLIALIAGWRYVTL